MYWRDIAFLCTETSTFDKFRKPQTVYNPDKKVFCNEKGVKRNEFYQAHAQGIKAELCLEVKTMDFANESHVQFNGKMYRIVRTYPVKNECIELICTALVVQNG